MQITNRTKHQNDCRPIVGINVEELYAKYGPMVLRRCRALLRDEDQAQDAMQDVFVLILRNRGRLDGRYPSSLLYRIATNTCLNRLRSNRRRRDFPNDDLLGSLPGSGRMEEETVDKLFLEQLFIGEREETRSIARLRSMEELSWKETARQTGLSVSGARKRMYGLRRHAMALMSA